MSPTGSKALKNISILLVEDDLVFSQLVIDFLSLKGASIQHVTNGQQGLKTFSKQTFDIVIADLNMPKLSGLPMLEQLMLIDPNLLAIVISGSEDMSDVVEALRLGACDYLVKPVTELAQIESAILQALISKKSIKSASEEIIEQQFAALSYQELNSNLQLLAQNTQAARNVQQHLFPASHIQYPKVAIDYSLFKNNDISAYYIDSAMVGNDHLVMYMAHFTPEDNSAAFGCVLLNSFINEKLKGYRIQQSQTVLHPEQMLTYIQDRLVGSGLHLSVSLVYISVDLVKYEATIAKVGKGLRTYLRNPSGLMPLALPDSECLGSKTWRKPSIHTRQLVMGEQLCVTTHIREHQQQLLASKFTGLMFNEALPAGGFMQLSWD